jgi:hypothetical protein
MQAAGIIADRIEGKVGTRRDEEDPEHQRRRVDMQAVIESIVTAMVNRSTRRPTGLTTAGGGVPVEGAGVGK